MQITSYIRIASVLATCFLASLVANILAFCLLAFLISWLYTLLYKRTFQLSCWRALFQMTSLLSCLFSCLLLAIVVTTLESCFLLNKQFLEKACSISCFLRRVHSSIWLSFSSISYLVPFFFFAWLFSGPVTCLDPSFKPAGCHTTFSKHCCNFLNSPLAFLPVRKISVFARLLFFLPAFIPCWFVPLPS